MDMKTHFPFRIDIWDDQVNNIACPGGRLTPSTGRLKVRQTARQRGLVAVIMSDSRQRAGRIP
jgi:hypothetical protein